MQDGSNIEQRARIPEQGSKLPFLHRPSYGPILLPLPLEPLLVAHRYLNSRHYSIRVNCSSSRSCILHPASLTFPLILALAAASHSNLSLPNAPFVLYFAP